VDVPTSIAVRRTVDGQVARSISIITGIIATEETAKAEPVAPKASVVKTAAVNTPAPEVSAVNTSAPEASAVGFSGSTADRWNNGDCDDGGGDQQNARHAIILSKLE
jgi:hypothetical protein